MSANTKPIHVHFGMLHGEVKSRYHDIPSMNIRQHMPRGIGYSSSGVNTKWKFWWSRKIWAFCNLTSNLVYQSFLQLHRLSFNMLPSFFATLQSSPSRNYIGSWACSCIFFMLFLLGACATSLDQNLSEASVNTHGIIWSCFGKAIFTVNLILSQRPLNITSCSIPQDRLPRFIFFRAPFCALQSFCTHSQAFYLPLQ